MRKLFILFTFVISSLFPAAFAQTNLEADISAAVSESGAEAAYIALISDENTTLTAEQKEALAALGTEAGVAFLNAVASGSSFSDAAVIAVTTTGASSETATQLVAQLTTNSMQSDSNASTGLVAETSEDTGELQTETAAGTTGTGTGTTTPVGSGAGAGGSGGGGVTASGN